MPLVFLRWQAQVTEDADTGTIPFGSVAVSGWNARFKNLKFGYDNNSDNDIDDGGDDVVFNDGFDGTTISPGYDDNGNLTKDADYAYIYDAWDNLVKIEAQNDTDVVIAEYTFYANDLRASKEVDNRGDLDETLYFFYDGPEVIEERNGSDGLSEHYVWGPNHIDELAMIMGLNGTYFAYQDANWNVIGLTTPGGDLAEEYNYTPYGRQLAWRHTGHADGDADGDVDSADASAFVAAYPSVKGEDEEYDRDFDADYDGDVDAFDMTAFTAAATPAGGDCLGHPGRGSALPHPTAPGYSRRAGECPTGPGDLPEEPSDGAAGRRASRIPPSSAA